MDVRCEKCQTEYELDEARLKPGGVTVKCTNCGHMFKIRKRAITNVGAPPVGSAPSPRSRTASPVQPIKPVKQRADSMFDEAPTTRAPGSPNGDDGPTTVERQWLIRLENGDQKSCRELATLQQWIVAGVVTRESLISRTGKTWKRLGDIAELAQYFDIADEARTTRDGRRAAATPPMPNPVLKGTMLGVGGSVKAAGGTIVPDDDRPTQTITPRTTPPPPLPPKLAPGARTPPMGSVVAGPTPSTPPPPMVTAPARRPITTPPPPPPRKAESGPHRGGPPPEDSPILASRGQASDRSSSGPVANPRGPTVPAIDGRSTAAWANEPVRAEPSGPAQSGPFVGKLSAISDEPAFAGKARIGEEAGFETGKVRLIDDDEDDLLPARRGSRAGLIIGAMVLLVGGGVAVGIFALNRSSEPEAKATADAALVAVAADAQVVVTPVLDAAEAPAPSALDQARGALLGDHEGQLKQAFDGIAALPAKDEPPAQAVRAHLAAALAQAELDRAGLVADKAEADKLRKDAKALALEAATSAQRAQKAAPEDPAANLALAAVLRLQGKPAREVQRYLDAARPAAGKDWTRDLALSEGLLLARDGKLDDAKAAFAKLDTGEGKLETSNDVRPRYHLALIALAQGKAADAKPLAEQVLAAQPEHAGAKALLAKLETAVANTDPLPSEEPPKTPPKTGGTTPPHTGGTTPPPVTGGSYDSLLARANQLAEGNCSRALELYAKALEQKPNGVEALSGMGYCHIDAKQFASAFSKFRAALAVSPRYEPALWGVAEAYQQQGRKEQAIEGYKAYLEVYPGSAKALKQLERLGGGDPPAQPPPPPPPAQPDGAGSGSG